MEENERLRAILGEWSTRAAKVLLSLLYSMRMTINFANGQYFFFFGMEPMVNVANIIFFNLGY